MFQLYFLKFLLIGLIFNNTALALENGLARTPPMGWINRQIFGCVIDCKKFPKGCMSENLFKRIGDLIVNEGYLDAGYEYVIIDDCWLEKERDNVTNKLVEDRSRFPSGFNYLANYLHRKQLKFGLYQNFCSNTRAGYPGIRNHMALDAENLANWGVDYVKLDGCYANLYEMDWGYPEFGKLLNRTGRPMIYSCSWPAYQEYEGTLPNYEALKEHCNLWRNWNEIDNSFESVAEIMNYFAYYQDRIQQHAGPGHWNDPGVLLLGNSGLTYDQSKQQMAVWSILAAPLIMSNELADIKPEIKEILQNKFVIAVDQDSLGIQGRLILDRYGIEVWSRPITPVTSKNQYSYAVAFVSRRADGAPYSIKFQLKELALRNKAGYSVTDLYNNNQHVGIHKPVHFFQTCINSNGVNFYKFTALN